MTAHDRNYLWKTSLLVWIVLPILAQLAALTAYLLVSLPSSSIGGGFLSIWSSVTLYVIAISVCVFASGSVAHWHLKRVQIPGSFLLRYSPILLPALMMWTVWIIDMHLRDGDFTKQGNIYIQIVFIPYIALVLVSSLARLHWLILLVPSIAIAGFGFFTWRASRKQVLASTRGLPVAGIVCTGLLVFISWQAYQRQIQMLSWLDNKEVFQEYLELQRYQPFQPNNRLVKLSPKPTLQFDAYTAPRLDGATAAYPVYAALAQAMYPERFVFDKIANNKTPSAYQRLIDGDTDAIFVAQASPEHVKLAKDRGVELIMTPVAREAFVFLVHEDNPVKQLTLAQTKAIYSGQITNWNELGGADTRIVAFQRPKNSGSQTVMEAKVMQGMAMKKPLQEEIQQGMGGLIRQVAAYRNSPSALGYSFRFYATSMQNPKNLSLISINNIAPTIENIRSGTYPLSVDVYMVTTQKSNPSVSQLRDWILSTEGQKLIADSGYIPR